MLESILKDNIEIADYIECLSPTSIDRGLIEDYFIGCWAVLEKCNVESLISGDENHNLEVAYLEMKYSKLPLITLPPLVVENGVIIDGNHRHRILKSLRVTEALIYRIES